MLKILTVLLLIATPAAAQTTLSLSVTGSASAAPDQMAASLTVQQTAKNAAAAQAAVNRAMASALVAARAVPGLAATTGDYNVNATDTDAGQSISFQASQDLNLTMAAPEGVPPAPFTSLLGRLQAQGLLLNNLGGQLSPQGQDRANAAAVTDALNRLQAQATSVAVALHDRVAAIKTLSLQQDDPVRLPVQQMMMRAAAPPPPQAAPGPVTVTANLNADVLLLPAP